ncbi:MAG: tRNA (N(6)-L-threonylcarbamoyladenosine(37)-C(2))-methylthiotransferase MtaB [Anaerolineaceae bacterium]
MKVYLDSVGCRLNQAEIEKMALEFRAAGHEIVESADLADLVVVNTCTVTSAAASDSRQKIRHANQAGVRQIVVTGCWASMSPGEALNLQGVTKVIANSEKDQLTARILGEQPDLYALEPLERTPLPGIHRRTRAFIKVQDGCDNFCTFCVTRLARGRSVSTSKEVVLNEVLSAEKGDAKEIVLSGVHLASWGRDLTDGERLSDLIAFLLTKTKIPRIRLSSIEPWDLDEGFFDLWNDPRLCKHFHLPLQSGSASVLKRMGRNTTPDLYRDLVSLIRSKVPEAAISTDIIVGFPGETELEFLESFVFVQEMKFASGHVFRYSARDETPASSYPNRVNGKIAHERGQLMREILAQSESEYQQKFINVIKAVLWESVTNLGGKRFRVHGLTDNYLPVTAISDRDLWNTISQVKIIKSDGDSLLGEILHNS